MLVAMGQAITGQAIILGHSTDRLVSAISAAVTLVAVTMVCGTLADGTLAAGTLAAGTVVAGTVVAGTLVAGTVADMVISRLSLGQAVVVVAVYARGP